MKSTIHISSKDPDRLKHAHAVRTSVFQKEQGVSAELDFDGKDEDAVHFTAYLDEQPIGTARIRFPSPGHAKLERFAVLSHMRGKKIGELILAEIEAYLIAQNIAEIVLNSQLSAKGFYERFGYVVSGEIFEEARIPHVKMTKSLR